MIDIAGKSAAQSLLSAEAVGRRVGSLRCFGPRRSNVRGRIGSQRFWSRVCANKALQRTQNLPAVLVPLSPTASVGAVERGR